MPSYVTPKKNTQFIFYVGLVDQSDTKVFKSNPTIAAGDFKVSTDGGALANLGTLPAVTPASSKMVKITLSTSEMNGDNVTVVGSDASGAEWCDLVINIQTSAQQIDDLSTASALATVAGYVDTEVAAIKAKTDNLPASPAATGDIPSASSIADAVWNRLTSALTTASSIGKLLVDNINATVGSRATQTSVDTVAGYVDTEVAAIKAKTDNLPSDPADASDIASAFSSLSSQVTTVDTVVDAIQAKTDNLPADPAATSDIPTAPEIADAVLDEPLTEPSGVFAWGTATLRNVVSWLGALSRNKMTQTATTTTLRNDADDADLATSAVSDNGSTFTKDEWS